MASVIYVRILVKQNICVRGKNNVKITRTYQEVENAFPVLCLVRQ